MCTTAMSVVNCVMHMLPRGTKAQPSHMAPLRPHNDEFHSQMFLKKLYPTAKHNNNHYWSNSNPPRECTSRKCLHFPGLGDTTPSLTDNQYSTYMVAEKPDLPLKTHS